MVGFLFLSINENNFEVSFEMSFLFLIWEGRNYIVLVSFKFSQINPLL